MIRFLDMAAITAGWLLVYYIAGGIGSAIGGGEIVGAPYDCPS